MGKRIRICSFLCALPLPKVYLYDILWWIDSIRRQWTTAPLATFIFVKSRFLGTQHAGWTARSSPHVCSGFYEHCQCSLKSSIHVSYTTRLRFLERLIALYMSNSFSKQQCSAFIHHYRLDNSLNMSTFFCSCVQYTKYSAIPNFSSCFSPLW